MDTYRTNYVFFLHLPSPVCSSPLTDALAQQCTAVAPTITTTTSSRVDTPKDEPATPDKDDVPSKDEPATPDKGDGAKDGKTALLVIDVQDCFVEVGASSTRKYKPAGLASQSRRTSRLKFNACLKPKCRVALWRSKVAMPLWTTSTSK